MESPPTDPWWYSRCVHGSYPIGHLTLLEEAEQLAVMYHHPTDLVHVCVDIKGVGSICRQLKFEHWDGMDRADKLRYVQGECDELKSVMH